MIGITTLEEYFSWLQNLSLINRKYTVLPLDEEHFEINANTRAINIPASFKKNGIAVQGDDLAEVLYFKIDRYFDYMDLNNTDIFIQWETPKDANGNTIKSVAPAYIRDIESEPGKLIFGWAISDAVTATSGTLKFSVRFFQWEDPDKAEQENGEKVLAYSFSTLTASVTIQPSINFNPETDEYNVDDVGDRLVERIENSEIVGGYAASLPVFIVDLDDTMTYDLEAETGLYDLLVQAQSTDTGAISYTWKRQALDENNKTDNQEIVVLESKNEFVAVDMSDLAQLSKSRTYYYMTSVDAEGNPTQPVLYKGAIPPTAEWIDEFKVLYEKQSAVKADQAGIYWAVAENRITNSSSSNNSKKAKFPRPEKVRITEQPLSNGVLQDANGVETPQTLRVGVGNTDGVLTYQWQKDENHKPSFGGEVANFVDIKGAIEDNYIVQEPGHYRVLVTNTRNKAFISEYSKESRITNSPNEAIVEYPLVLTYYVSNLEDSRPEVKIDPSIESDEYRIAWYLYKEIEEDRLIVGNLPVNYNDDKTITASFNPLDYLERYDELEEDIEGYYYCVVTNKVNGVDKETEKLTDYTKMFVIAD